MALVSMDVRYKSRAYLRIHGSSVAHVFNSKTVLKTLQI